MLDGIDVHVINVCREVLVIANAMLPESLLPNWNACIDQSRGNDAFRIRGFDEAPTLREICIAFGQRPHGMNVIGQHDPSVDGERQLLPTSRTTLRKRSIVASLTNTRFLWCVTTVKKNDPPGK